MNRRVPMESQTVIKTAWGDEVGQRHIGNILQIKNFHAAETSPMFNQHRNGMRSRPMSCGGASAAFVSREKIFSVYKNKDGIQKVRP
jgi:hypothetical protein